MAYGDRDDWDNVGVEVPQEDRQTDPWGRPWGDPWFGIDPNTPTGPVPYAPGKTAADDPDPMGADDPPAPSPTPSPAPSGGGGGGGTLSSLLTAYPGQFQRPDAGNSFRQAVDLLGPLDYQPFSYEAFQAPSWENIGNDPGYQFRVKQGEQSLMNNRAAQGLTRSGGTLKELLNYNQGMASQEFGNVFDRAERTYDRNRGNAFGAWQANLEPELFEWSTKANVGQRGIERDYDNAFKEFQSDYDIWRNNQNDWLKAAQWDLDFGLDAAGA